MPWIYMGKWMFRSCMLDSTSWKFVVSFTSWPLYPQRKSPQYPLGRTLGGPLNWSGKHGEKKNLASTRTQTPPLRHPGCRQSLYWLHCPNSLRVVILRLLLYYFHHIGSANRATVANSNQVFVAGSTAMSPRSDGCGKYTEFIKLTGKPRNF
jgi:hypothetical protein